MHILRSTRTFLGAIFFFCMVATLTFLMMHGLSSTSAASFNAGNIMSDAVMSDYDSMTVEEIQAFLTEKNPCDNRNYALYQEQSSLYPGVTWHWEGGADGHFVCLSEERFGDGTVIGSGQTAAEIIYQAAQDYRINPQVLIVLLQKEQGLITDTYPHSGQYRSATGYGCPDTAACDTKYYGFKNQVRNAAALFRNVLDNDYYLYPSGTTSQVRFSPNASCGSSAVYIENRATAALYRYTPYQPNAAALAAGYGSGDACSSYGNRNFFLYFTDWFGSTQVPAQPDPLPANSVTANLPNGIYQFTSALSNDVRLGSNRIENAANVNLTAASDTPANQWYISREASGFYTFRHVVSGRYLDLAGANTAQGTNIQLWEQNNACAERWQIVRTADGTSTFRSACDTRMALDVFDAQSTLGTNLQLWGANNTAAQKWHLYTGNSLADGTYTIATTVDSQKVIDLFNNESAAGTNIQLWGANGTTAQDWALAYNAAADAYTITNPNGNRFDLAGSDTTNGNNIRLWTPNESCAELWRIVPDLDGNYTILSACSADAVVDRFNAETADGTNIQIWESNNTAAQRWRFNLKTLSGSGSVSTPDFAPAPSNLSGTYTIVSQLHDQRVIDLFDNRNGDGVNIQLYEKNGTTAQVWTLAYNAAADAYTITNPNGRRLDLADAAVANRSNIHLWGANDTCAQLWHIAKNDDGSYTFFSNCDRRFVVDVDNAGTANGTNIQLWESNGTPAQKWYLIPR